MSSNMGIKGKIMLGFCLVIALSVIAATVTLLSVNNTEKFANRVVKTDLVISDALIDLSYEVYQSQVSTQAFMITKDKNFVSQFDALWDAIYSNQLIIDQTIKNWTNSNDIIKWEDTKSLLTSLKKSQLKAINTLESNPSAALQVMTTEVIPVMTKISNNINLSLYNEKSTNPGLLDIESKILNAGANEILYDLSTLRIVEYILLILIFTFSISIAYMTARRIVNPINSAVNIAQEIASGERNIKIKISTHDETGVLLSSLDKMQEAIRQTELKLLESEKHTRDIFDEIMKSAQLFRSYSNRVASGDLTQHLELSESKNKENEVMIKLGGDLNKMTKNLSIITKEITGACHEMVSSLDEVRHSVDAQSVGTSEQASSINEITASITEIEKSSMQTMDKAKALGEVAERTREKGQLGVESVDQSISGMKQVREKVQLIAQTILDLSRQTQQVGEITAVVTNLAQQSKMLALNASIEAAKAGEAGKGFAVVAVEVKNLAEQSEQSTTQVQKILEDIRHATEKAVMVTEEGTRGVDRGTELVEQTGDIIRGLNDIIHEATLASQQIEAAVRQESAGIEQITAGMNEINQVTATFVEGAKQTTEAMSNLSKVAKHLKSQVDTYKI